MRKNNLFYLAIAAILSIGLFSCSDDNDDNKELILAKSEIQVALEGTFRYIDIEGGSGDYSVKSDNEDIATAKINLTDNYTSILVITPVTKGKTTITVSDGKTSKSILVTIVDPYQVLMHSEKDSQIITTDNDTGALIESELEQNSLFGIGNIIMMAKDEANTLYVFENKEDAQNKKTYIAKGTYLFEDIENSPYLTIKIKNKTHHLAIGGDALAVRFFFSIYKPEWLAPSQKSKSTEMPLLKITLKEDLTKDYINKYPGVAIGAVTRNYSFTIINPSDYPLPTE